MNQGSQQGLSPPSQSALNQKISAKTIKSNPNRVSQADIFCDLKIIERLSVIDSNLVLNEIAFPYLVCLSQECDLERDFEESQKHDILPSPKRLIHLLFAPAFNFDDFLTGKHWGDLFEISKSGKRRDTKIKAIIDNETPRYHYLRFSEIDEVDGVKLPELLIDFKHYFTINRNCVYSDISKRLCSIDDLFREKISQRFSYFISRIGLPE